MAVSETGACLGSFSGVSVEPAVVAEAMRVMAEGQAEVVRSGAGSRYIDIRLPCGGGIDLLFTPFPSPVALDQVVSALAARQSIGLELGCNAALRARHRLDALGQIDRISLPRAKTPNFDASSSAMARRGRYWPALPSRTVQRSSSSRPRLTWSGRLLSPGSHSPLSSSMFQPNLVAIVTSSLTGSSISQTSTSLVKAP